jgi:hypothetical protein
MITHPATSEKIRRNITKQWNDGIRDKHGEKLKANWATTPERNSIQAKVMTKALTKYEYLVTDDVGVTIILNYQELTERGLKSCMSTFHRKKTNEIVFKGNRILRRKING